METLVKNNARRSPCKQKYSKITAQLTQQINDAASKVAQPKQLKLVLTREGIGYGGIDITPDVEKSLNITEKATPTPSPEPSSCSERCSSWRTASADASSATETLRSRGSPPVDEAGPRTR